MTKQGGEQSPDAGFLTLAEVSADAQRLLDEDLEELGYVMNTTRLWAQQPATHAKLVELLGQLAQDASLTLRQRGILVTACASALGDSYCALAWGNRLAGEAGAELAGAVLRGEDDQLDPAEQALARWARQVVVDPNATDSAGVQALRDVGYDDAQIFAITAFVGFRLAFSTVNDALGARPDRALSEAAPAPVRDAITFGRPIARGDG
jgi:uncharacterized peroxidase-related enzyme